MKKLLGIVLGFALLLLGILTPIVLLAGISGLIWGGQVFDGHMPKNSPAFKFMLGTMPPAIYLGAYFTLCLFVLPVFARFNVQVVSKRERKNFLTAYARLMRKLASSYAALMDKLIAQEKAD